MKILKNFELKLYLQGWLNNVGFHYNGVEYTLMEAMQERVSLRNWFGTSEIDYDEEFALAFLHEEFSKRRE